MVNGHLIKVATWDSDMIEDVTRFVCAHLYLCLRLYVYPAWPLMVGNNRIGNQFEPAKNGYKLDKEAGNPEKKERTWTDENLAKEYPGILESIGGYTFNSPNLFS